MKGTERSLNIETLFSVLLMLVDDWLKQNPWQRAGRKAVFSDSKVVSLISLVDFVPYPNERQYLGRAAVDGLVVAANALPVSTLNARLCKNKDDEACWQILQ